MVWRGLRVFLLCIGGMGRRLWLSFCFGLFGIVCCGHGLASLLVDIPFGDVEGEIVDILPLNTRRQRGESRRPSREIFLHALEGIHG
jgi:hypothetical protein